MKNEITSVTIIGAGNVAYHLGKALKDKGITISHLWSRTKENAQLLALEFGAELTELNELPENQIALVCLSDDAIQPTIAMLPQSIPVAYTSGSVNLGQISSRNDLGVFYPLQTISKAVELDLSEVPFLIEATNSDFEKSLIQLAKRISSNVHVINSEQRQQLHHSAVWINNFTNHLIYQAQELTKSGNLDFELLQPLLKETIRKVEKQSAYEAQTGPARRNDIKTLQKHLDALSGTSKELYALLSKSIQETYSNDKL